MPDCHVRIAGHPTALRKTLGRTDYSLVLAITPELQTTNMPQDTTLRRCIPLFVWIITLCAILWIPARILSHGYLPIDDALRHAAKAVSGKSWSEIIVVADWVKMDHHAGWHAILTTVHQLTGWQPDALVMFSIFTLFCAFCMAPLVWFRRPEVWLGVLLILSVAFPVLLGRLAYGRPLILSGAILMTLLLMWHHEPTGPIWKRFITSIFLFAAAAWIHGSWCLFVLPVVAFALALRWRATLWLGAAWLAGSFLGGLFTGHPIDFLWQSMHAILRCFSAGIPTARLAIELQPSGGDLWAVVIVAVVIGWRLWSGVKLRELIMNAPFMLAALGFLLGLKTMRFWLDWGLPALLCWLALQLKEPAQQMLPERSLSRLFATCAMALGLTFFAAGDSRHDWSANLTKDYISTAEPETAEWLPAPGGIVYHPQQGVFYRLFFKNPHAEWRYVMGFEPTFMTEENFAGFRRILDNPHTAAGYELWVKKMRTEDRLIVDRPEPLPIEQLEWKKFGHNTWIGRLPRTVAKAPTTASVQ